MNMKASQLRKIAAALVAGSAAMAVPQFASAEQTQVTNTTGLLTTPAHLDFSIVIPRFLRFRVGTVGATIDQITFTVLGANVGNATAVAGTGGDALGTGSNVSVVGNGGQITIGVANNSGGFGLKHATLAEYINYSQISTLSTDTTNLDAPVLSNAGGTSVTPVLSAGYVTNRSAVWNYSYLNNTVPSAGTYGTNANGGLVTYTASMP
jgi:hypothetical protein